MRIRQYVLRLNLDHLNDSLTVIWVIQKRTKRFVFRLMSMLFGPIGLVAPLTVNAPFMPIDILLDCGHNEDKNQPRVMVYRFLPCTAEMPAFLRITILSLDAINT